MYYYYYHLLLQPVLVQLTSVSWCCARWDANNAYDDLWSLPPVA